MSERAYRLLGHLPPERISGDRPYFFRREGEWVCVGQNGFATGASWQEARAIWQRAIDGRAAYRDALAAEKARIAAQAAEHRDWLARQEQERAAAAAKRAAAHVSDAGREIWRRRAGAPDRHSWPEFGGDVEPSFDVPIRDHNGEWRYIPVHAYLDLQEAMQ